MTSRDEFDLTIVYSPTNRATCDYCSGIIDKGEMRMSFKKRSEYHDTFDVKWNHAMCQLGKCRIDSLRGYTYLRYSDCAKIRPKFNFDGVTNESPAELKKYTTESDELWKIIKEFEDNLKPGELKALMRENGLSDKFGTYEQLYWVALGMFRGLLPPCPECNNHHMVPYRDRVICLGHLSGFAACAYRGELSKFPARYQLRIPADVKSKFLKEWEHPNPAFAKTLLPQIGGAAASSSGEGASSSAGAADEDGAGGSTPSVANYALPDKGSECRNMVICFVGKFFNGDQEMSLHELEELVTGHGGKVSADVGDNTTHVIVSDAEAKKKTKPKLVTAALKKNLPILAFKYFTELLGIPDADAATTTTTTSTMTTTTSATASASVDATAADAKPSRGRKKGAKSEPAPATTTTTTTTTAAAVADAGPKAKRGRKKAAEDASDAQSVTAVAVAASATVGSGASPAPNVQLRLPTVLSKSGYLLYNSQAGEAHLEKTAEKTSTKRKLEELESSQAKKPRLAPLPGSEILKVHPEAKLGANSSILVTADNLAFNCTMNNVDLTSGKNRFYIIQLIQQGSQYIVFKKWGRTGDDQYNGTKSETYTTKEAAIADFAKKYKECTNNTWGAPFSKVPGRYFVVELDSGHDSYVADESITPSLKDRTVLASQLDPRLQKLVTILFDKEQMVSTMKSMNIDVKKMPLGKLSKDMIMDGYRVLRRIEELLNADITNAGARAKLLDFSTRFYSMVPHSFASGILPPLIDNKTLLQEKVSMLESLIDMEVASKLMGAEQMPTKDGSFKHPMDAHYESLRTELVPMDKESEEYKMLVEFTANSQQVESYTPYKIQVVDIYTIEREGEKARFEPWKTSQNRQLLWHGSRLSNWVGILSQGLRIAPPEAPVSGYLFGKGVYFANCVSKSSVYCRADKSNPTALMMLSEISLGKTYDVTTPTYMESAKAGHHSTMALGKIMPDPAGSKTLGDNGVIVPMGKMIKRKEHTTMGHDEFIVYNVAQIKTRYLLEMKFT